ncbi:MAG: 5-formyltetrahydrofolate cyclo-ligase [Burkholderiaceae bacterium]|nr:5-formyltetrahydrofolate cyclo-ligase [Burkholderiaceae bacterium]
MQSPLGEAKKALRTEILARRGAMSPGDREARALRIDARLRQVVASMAPVNVLSYVAFGTEFDTSTFNGSLMRDGVQVYLPRIDKASRELHVHRVTSLVDGLEPGTWGILEPVPSRCPRWTGSPVIDLVLVPGVAFDLQGGRLGYGAGYYDRLLPGLGEALRVAAAFECQVVDVVPVDGHDLPVDILITDIDQYSVRS